MGDEEMKSIADALKEIKPIRYGFKMMRYAKSVAIGLGLSAIMATGLNMCYDNNLSEVSDMEEKARSWQISLLEDTLEKIGDKNNNCIFESEELRDILNQLGYTERIDYRTVFKIYDPRPDFFLDKYLKIKNPKGIINKDNTVYIPGEKVMDLFRKGRK